MRVWGRWICVTCLCVWNTTCASLVSFDSSWESSTQRLEGILWESSFICAGYMLYCAAWIRALCISLTRRGADTVKLYSAKHDCFRTYCFHCFYPIHCLSTEAPPYHGEIAFGRLRVISLQREHNITKYQLQTEIKNSLLTMLTVQAAIYQFYYVFNVCIFLHCTWSVFMGKAVPLPQQYIQLTVSENSLTLAKSYFTGTAKQKNNSKVCLSRKPVWKFNKWLFQSQCSHNWWSEIETDVRQRFLFSEIIIRNKRGGWSMEGYHPTGPSCDKQNQSGENCSFFGFPQIGVANHPPTLFIRINIGRKIQTRYILTFSTEAVQSGELHVCLYQVFFPVVAMTIKGLCQSKFPPISNL